MNVYGQLWFDQDMYERLEVLELGAPIGLILEVNLEKTFQVAC